MSGTRNVRQIVKWFQSLTNLKSFDGDLSDLDGVTGIFDTVMR